MPSATVVRNLLRELFSFRSSERVTEPDLVMDDPDKVAAYVRAGREDGVMAPVFLFHCAQICEVIRPGDTVLDLGCGPATQLAMVARLNPRTNFIGVDLSDEMLDIAREHVASQGLQNVRFERADMSRLTMADASVDAVVSTVALHHLPDVETLERVFAEVRRVLKPSGGLYLVDFGHLKSERSIHGFAYQFVERQAELFTLDYLYSLRAAFWPEDWRRLAKRWLLGEAQFYSTFGMPFMVAVKSAPRRSASPELLEPLRQLIRELPEFHRNDLKDLKTFFGLGGLKSMFLDAAGRSKRRPQALEVVAPT